MRIAVLGAGSWGTALAVLLAEGGHEVALWGRNAAVLAERRENERYLPGRRLPDRVRIATRVDDAVRGVALVTLALPSGSVRAVAAEMAPGLSSDTTVVCASKGLEGRLTLDAVIAEAAPGPPVAMLS